LKLKPTTVSVRSSSASEDLASASFAGIYDSFLNVNGLHEIVRRVKDCWASLFSERCLHYFAQQVKQNRIATPELSIAVIIQQLINSQKSGICFTSNPETSRLDQVVIQAAYGLGEGVVSGQIPSDVYLIEKTTEKIISQNIAEVHSAVVPRSSGGVREITIDEQSDPAPVLSQDETTELTRLSIDIEAVFNAPQDIEWAKDAKMGFFVLQSRPITTGARNL
jgi:pyruvate,water dikinase